MDTEITYNNGDLKVYDPDVHFTEVVHLSFLAMQDVS